jgi:hypothetical protein
MIGLLLALSAVNTQSSEPALTDDDTTLFGCSVELIRLFLSGIIVPDVYHRPIPDELVGMLSYSGKGINDMGDYNGCQYLTDNTNYVLIELAANVYIALCLPEQCGKEQIEDGLMSLLGEQASVKGLKAPSIVAHTLIGADQQAFHSKALKAGAAEIPFSVHMVKHENNKLVNEFGPGRVAMTIITFLLFSV